MCWALSVFPDPVVAFEKLKKKKKSEKLSRNHTRPNRTRNEFCFFSLASHRRRLYAHVFASGTHVVCTLRCTTLRCTARVVGGARCLGFRGLGGAGGCCRWCRRTREQQQSLPQYLVTGVVDRYTRAHTRS